MSATTAEIIDNELHRRGKVRKWLVDTAGINRSSFEKAMSGQRPFPAAMLARISDTLAIALPSFGQDVPAVAPEALGAYSRAGVRWLEGCYMAMRYSPQAGDMILIHDIRIAWDDLLGCLAHYHRDHPDGAVYQRGEVSVPLRSGHIFLVINKFGQHEMTTLMPPTGDAMLYGIVSGLFRDRALHVPGCSAIVLAPYDATDRQSMPPFGVIAPDHVAYQRFVRLLADAESHLVMLPHR